MDDMLFSTAKPKALHILETLWISNYIPTLDTNTLAAGTSV